MVIRENFNFGDKTNRKSGVNKNQPSSNNLD